jgi:hypothetical protein
LNKSKADLKAIAEKEFLEGPLHLINSI